ncbi:MAG: TldD/PmbA family protein [Pseudobdellovibrionaceae bacterium]|nr:TldD/PmbA family protein [Pseudobdellovibrionaceae bacterium]
MMRKIALKLADAMDVELRRSMEQLRAPRHPRPYYISYLVRDIENYTVWARYGSLYQDKREQKRVCYADVRVGSYRYDNTSKGGLSDTNEESEANYEITELPIENDLDSFRFSLWRLTDARFRDAVSKFHGKKSRDVSFLDQNRSLPSFQKLPGEQSVGPLRSFAADQDYWRTLVKKASVVFKKFPEIKNSYVEFSADLVTKIFVSSEGVQRIWQEPLYSLSAYFWYHTQELDQDYNIVRHVARLDELPDLEEFKKLIERKVAQFRDVAAGDEMTSYAGPVLLAPKAAGLFLHEVVGHRLEGSRLLSESEGRTFRDKVSQRIMHPDLTLIDDPGLTEVGSQSLIAHYPFDDEGAPARRAVLVEKGVLKGFLTTRSPLQKRGHQSNGHARNHGDERPISRMANLVVRSHSQNTWDDLKRMLMDEIKRRHLPYGIILLDVEGGETETEAYNFQAFLGQIAVAIKIFPNGKEKYVRGVDFVGTPLSSLNDIIGVGRDLVVDNGFCGAESGTVPVSTVAPAMLLSNLELQAKNPSKVTQYAMDLPWFDKKLGRQRKKSRG